MYNTPPSRPTSDTQSPYLRHPADQFVESTWQVSIEAALEFLSAHLHFTLQMFIDPGTGGNRNPISVFHPEISLNTRSLCAPGQNADWFLRIPDALEIFFEIYLERPLGANHITKDKKKLCKSDPVMSIFFFFFLSS